MNNDRDRHAQECADRHLEVRVTQQFFERFRCEPFTDHGPQFFDQIIQQCRLHPGGTSNVPKSAVGSWPTVQGFPG